MSRLRKEGKSAETTKAVPDHADEPSNCIICLERVSCRGKLSVCSHWFCFPCILEWAENTNTCPICKARFRCITKVYTSPFKSPPTKVRVGDKDQRVWNDDDDLVADDIPSDDFDDDYVPPNREENPWTSSLQNRGQQQQHDVRTERSQTSRQLQLDQYDFEDSFIDDTDEALQAYLHSTYSRESVRINNDADDNVINDDDEGDKSDTGGSSDESVAHRDRPYTLRNSRAPHTRPSRTTVNSLDSRESVRINHDADDDVINDDEGDKSDTGESSDESVAQRDRPYTLRNSRASHTRSSRTTVNYLDSLARQNEEQSRASPASTGSFVTSGDESDDDLNGDWVPFGNHSKNSRTKGKNQVKTRKQDSKTTKSLKQSGGPSTRQSKRSQRDNKQDPDQRQNDSKRKRKQTPISDDEFQEATSSRNGENNYNSSVIINGWISMTEKRAKAHASTSSHSRKRTRERTSFNNQTKNVKSNAKKPVGKKDSSSDSDDEVLRDCTNIKQQSRQRASYSTMDTKPTNNWSSSRLKRNQHVSSTLTSTRVQTHEGTPSNSSEDEDNLSDAAVVQPTPCSKTTRSIFTKRRHRSPVATFDRSEDTKSLPLSRSQTQHNKLSGSPNCKSKTVNTHGRKVSETALALKSDLQVKLLPMKKQKRKRVMSLSSDSD